MSDTAASLPKGIQLFRNVIWPAVAGNVAWALLNMHVDAVDHWKTLSRSLPLFFLAAYMLMALYIGRVPVSKFWYYFLDGVMACAIAIYAIALYAYAEWASVSLAVVFAAAFFGYCTGAWYKALPRVKFWWLVGVNFFAAGVVYGNWYFGYNVALLPPLCIATVVAVWLWRKPWAGKV